jgi:two-component system, NarL family, invasion response regulator UvrY
LKRILLVDDHEVFRSGLKRVLERLPGKATFGEAGNFQRALKLVREQDWDLMVLDISLGDRNGLEVLTELKQIRPHLPVFILTMHSEERFARRALKAGASAYVTKTTPRTELVKAINKVLNGGKYISATIAQKLIFDLDMDSGPLPHEALSDREFEVLCLVASGKTAGEIAVILSLSNSTVSTYRGRILKKMGMKTNSELMYYAMHNKLVA